MVLDNLISRCILMIEDREEIIKPATQSERNKVLLDILTERPYGTFKVFKDVLKESDPYNTDVQELVSRMQFIESCDKNISCHDIVFHEHIVKLQKNYMMFVHDVYSKTDIADYLYETGVLNTEEKEEICSSSITRHESNRILYAKLFRKGEDAYKHLLKALRHGQYEDITSNIENTQVSEHEIQLCQLGMKKLREREKKKDFHVIQTKLEDLTRIHDEVIPYHILEQFERRLKQWKEDDKMFFRTAAEKQVRTSILTENCVAIVGNSGTGKTFLSHHVSLTMMDQGYIIIPCESPGDIRQWFKHGRKTIFVFDDVCGRYTLNQQIFNEWKQRLEHIKSLLEDNCCKMMFTCRLDVYKEEQFSSLSIFKTCTIDLSSQELRLSAAERFALAKMYFGENAGKVTELSEKYDFFPLLCSLYHKQKLQKHINISNFFSNPFDVFQNELENLYREGDAGKMKYCSLVLCVMFNNTLKEEMFSIKFKKSGAVIEDLLDKCELSIETSMERLRKSLETLEGTYVVKEDGTYKIIHDKLFDFLAKYFGEKMIQLFIDHAKTGFIRERFICETVNNMDTDIEFAIRIPDNKMNRFIERLLKDWEDGFVDNVFDNRNMNSSTFKTKFINNLNKLDQSKQEELACKHDIKSKDIALGGSCYVGSVDLVRWLISRKSDINYCKEDGCFPLFWASQEGHINVVEELLQQSAEVNQYNNNGVSSLHIASQNGHVNVVKELLKYSAEVNQCNFNGVSPLYIASQDGNVDIVKVLLQHSAHVNQCMINGVSPLWQASQNGHVDVVKELLQHLAEVNRCDEDGYSPLYIASQEGHVDVVNELLQNSTEVNQCANNGTSPLWIASQNGHVNVVKVLLKHSADANVCVNNSITPLLIACYYNRMEVVHELLKYNDVDIDICDSNGCSSIYIASQQGHVNVVKELLQHAVEVNRCKNNGVSPLYIASAIGHVNVVKELLQHSATVSQCDNDGVSPLYIASQNGHVDVVIELLKHSAEVNQCDNNGVSPLSIACQEGHVNVVKELLQNSADVNQCDNDGISPLTIASQNGQVDVVKELLQHSADVKQCENDGNSPL
ncbi:uncharacterized protein LOC127711644 [Mytilus californianus]|uniref:uncharacterized protein LOC127711644 n=1 Tax=Mytilus californianus TaxID=6549 RepID=UPI002245F136|nr:uncharacterized protein LOC127711644 [Mytilus californianus]